MRLPIGLLASEQSLSQLFGEQGDFLPRLNVARIEVASRQNHQIAHGLVVLVAAIDGDVLLLALDQHFVECGHDSGRRDDAVAKLLADRVDVGALDVVGVSLSY